VWLLESFRLSSRGQHRAPGKALGVHGAATALGQVGSTRAVPDLLAANARADDSFIDHSVIYALIELKTPGPALEALPDSSPITSPLLLPKHI
jgi:hypothetical protein